MAGRPRWAGSPAVLTALAALPPVVVLAVLGRLAAWPSPDLPSYLASTGLDGMRLPLYGALMRLLPMQGLAVPLLQWAAFAAAAARLSGAIRRAGASPPAALAVGLALVWGTLPLLWGNALLPEVPAHAALLWAFAMALDLAARPARWWRVAGTGAAVTLAWALRPSLLPFAVLLPPLPALLGVERRRVAAWLALACLAPPLLLASVRRAGEGDFNVVSFGGFQMSGIAALMLTPEIAARLPDEQRGLATDIVAGRERLVAAGAVIGLPENSRGRRSFVSAAALYFDILARTHDTVLYGAVLPLRRAGEAWPAFNVRLQRLALATIAAAPLDYAAWVAGGLARLVGHALVLNPVFLLAAAAWLALAARPPRPGAPADARILGVLGAVYVLGTAAPSILLTFPAERYIDSTALPLAAWPLYGVLRRLGQARG